MSTTAENAAALRESWCGILCASAQEVFSMMVGAELTTPTDPKALLVSQITGMVGIAGAVSATLSLRCSMHSGTRIASQMLGVALEEAAAQQCDAIGEICNMVAGQFKAKIGLESECMLSVPTIITGKHYELHSRVDYDRLEMPLSYEEELLWLALDLRR
jgi:chemotaxis protein CheX